VICNSYFSSSLTEVFLPWNRPLLSSLPEPHSPTYSTENYQQDHCPLFWISTELIARNSHISLNTCPNLFPSYFVSNLSLVF
jgi:hypothetical protein